MTKGTRLDQKGELDNRRDPLVVASLAVVGVPVWVLVVQEEAAASSGLPGSLEVEESLTNQRHFWLVVEAPMALAILSMSRVLAWASDLVQVATVAVGSVELTVGVMEDRSTRVAIVA